MKLGNSNSRELALVIQLIYPDFHASNINHNQRETFFYSWVFRKSLKKIFVSVLDLNYQVK